MARSTRQKKKVSCSLFGICGYPPSTPNERILPGGTLAEPSEDLLKLTKSAPVHNIFAERTLGTADSTIRRSPNATIAYVDCYVRIVHNHTYKFLNDLPSKDRNSIIAYAVKHRKYYDRIVKSEDKELDAELLKRQLESRLSRQAQGLAAGDVLIGKMVSGLISPETLFENELFQDITVGDSLAHEIQSILKTPKCLIDKYFTHVWTGEVKGYLGSPCAWNKEDSQMLIHDWLLASWRITI